MNVYFCTLPGQDAADSESIPTSDLLKLNQVFHSLISCHKRRDVDIPKHIVLYRVSVRYHEVIGDVVARSSRETPKIAVDDERYSFMTNLSLATKNLQYFIAPTYRQNVNASAE